MARLIVSAAMLLSRALSVAGGRRGFMFGSPLPSRAATVISFDSLVKSCPRLASEAPFCRLIVDQCECPPIRSGVFYIGAGRGVKVAASLSRIRPSSSRPARLSPLPEGGGRLGACRRPHRRIDPAGGGGG